jgi:predicted nicotinamide N-methyase
MIRSLLDNQQCPDLPCDSDSSGISSALWPLFGLVWPNSRVLASLLLSESLADKRILEIGCGIGLPSLLARHLGANITATDYHPLAQSFLLRNTELNSLNEIPYEHMDWRSPQSQFGTFDLIIGSDLLYEPGQVQPISRFISDHLTSEGEMILVDPGRGYQRKFAREMLRHGFSNSWQNLRLHSEESLRQKGFIFRFVRV